MQWHWTKNCTHIEQCIQSNAKLYFDHPPPPQKIVLDQLNDSEKRGGGQKSEESRIIYILSRGAKNCKVLVKRDLQAQMINLL